MQEFQKTLVVCRRLLLLFKRIQRFNTKRFKVAHIACGDGQSMHRGCRRDERILGQGIGSAVHQSCPLAAYGGVQGQHLSTDHDLLQPGLDLGGFGRILRARQFDAALQFADRQGGNVERGSFLRRQPSHYAAMWFWLARL